MSPILIIGPARSGTTLLATMLNAHPRVFIANETKVFVTVLPGALRRGEELSMEAASRLLARLERDEMRDHAPLPDAKELARAMPRQDVPSLLRELFRSLAKREGKVRWGEKTAVAYRCLPEIQRAFPDAHLIGLIRDPAEIATSYARLLPKWGALGGLIHWLDFHRAVLRAGGDAAVFPVRYRRLVEDPESTLGSVCRHVREPYDDAMLRFHATTRARELSASEIFRGSSQPLYEPKGADRRLEGGLAGLVLRRAIRGRGEEAAPRHMRPPPWERLLRTVLFLRAALSEISSPASVKQRFRRIVRP